MNTTQLTPRGTEKSVKHCTRKLSIIPAVALLAFVQGCATNQTGSSTDNSSYGDVGMSVATTNTVTTAPSSSADQSSASQPVMESSDQAAVKETPATSTVNTSKPSPSATDKSTSKTETVATKKTAETKKKEPVKAQKPVKAKTETKKETETAKAAVKKTVEPEQAKVETKPVKKVEKKTEAKPEEVQVALAEPTAPDSNMPVVEEAVSDNMAMVPITAADLPYNFGTWTLERNWDNRHPDTCRLISGTHKINDGYELTNIRAEVLLEGINIYTGSNIDLTYENSGIQIGSLSLVPYSGLMGDSGVTVEGDFTEMLANAGELTVNLGFWPTWPKTETQQLVLPLEDMRLAIPALLNCKNL